MKTNSNFQIDTKDKPSWGAIAAATFGVTSIITYTSGIFAFSFGLCAIIYASLELRKIKKGKASQKGKPHVIIGFIGGTLGGLWGLLKLFVLFKRFVF